LAPTVSHSPDNFPEASTERLQSRQGPPSGTIRIILDLKDINYHRTFYLAPSASLKQVQHTPATTLEPLSKIVPTAYVASYAPALATAVLPPFSSKACLRDSDASKSRWSLVDNPPASIHLYAMSKLGPLSPHLPENIKKARLEDKKMIEFMMLQSSKSCSDLGFLHRVRKTIRKVRSYWNKINPVYPFAFRKLRNRNGRPTGYGPRPQRLGGSGPSDDMAGFYIITEDFSNKVVNPEGTGHQSDDSGEEIDSESGRPSLPSD
jgi:hypothetical protein